MLAASVSFSVPKAGNAPSENDDACHQGYGGTRRISRQHQPLQRRHGRHLRFAVADGASEGILTGMWARVLVDSFCHHGVPCLRAEDHLELAWREWGTQRKAYLEAREKNGQPIRWYEEPGLAAGASAAFLGLTVAESRDVLHGSWQAIAAGDCCLFQVRGDQLVACFPVEQSVRFDNYPSLASSNPERRDVSLRAYSGRRGYWRAHDRFYLTTDALAAWFLGQHEHGLRPWLRLQDLHGPQSDQRFEWLVSELRASRQIRNDDVTLVAVEMG